MNSNRSARSTGKARVDRTGDQKTGGGSNGDKKTM